MKTFFCNLSQTSLKAAFAVFLASSTAIVSADTIIDDFTDARNDRFTNNSSDFIFPSGFNLSGVGRAIDSGRNDDGRWATLIGDNVFLSAAHFPPNTGATIAFFPGNDPNDTPFTANVIAGGSRVVTADGRTDLFVGYLDRTIDSSISRYNFADVAIQSTPGPQGTVNIDPNNPFQGELGFIVGISPTDRTRIEIDQSVGINRVTGYAENVDFQGNQDNDTIVYQYNDPDDPNYVFNESAVSGGDSGAPNFILDDQGDLLLLGVNSFRLDGDPVEIVDPVTNISNTFQFQSSGISYTGNVADEINSLIAGAPIVSAVPEPSAICVLALTSILAVKRRRSM